MRHAHWNRNNSRRIIGMTLIAAMVALVAPCSVWAQSVYKTPPADVVRMVDAPPPPSLSLDPTGATALVLERAAMPSIKDLAAPMLRLAGVRLNPDTDGPHMPWSSFVTLRLKDVATGRERDVRLPDDARIGFPRWAPDGSRAAFTLTFDDRIELWTVDRADAKASRVADLRVNATLTNGFEWMPDSRRLIVATTPPARGERPQAPRTPTGPVTQETTGVTSPVRTYQDLLESPHDEALFDYFTTVQLAIVDTRRGRTKPIGKPAAYTSFEPSPNGRFLLTERVVRPYSYLVPFRSFPDVVEAHDLVNGATVEVARRPLRDQTPIGGVPTGPRSIAWKDTAEATLMWVEALDGGDPKTEVPHRDQMFMLESPFAGVEPKPFMKTEHRLWGASWLEGGELVMVNEYDRDRRWIRTWLVDADDASDPRLVVDRSIRDRYNDPGRPVTTMNSAGRSVVHVNDGAIFLSGSGASNEGDRPFLDRLNLATLTTERLWQSEGEAYETFSELLTPDGSIILTRRETTTEPPNYFKRDLRAGSRVAFTDYEDPVADFQTRIKKELVTYERADGVTLSATLYLPPDHRAGERLPLVVWAYPREFNDAATAGQVSGSPYRYTRISGSSHLFFLTQGYAVMDDASMPVVGDDPLTVNDTFIQQIVDSADAAIQFAAERGVADPDRAGVGGHSYGAFMTANLLAHSDLFRGGIARSGAYNRTLTPFGFQSEERTFWEAPDVYFNLSPFMHAHQINEPILLIHGMVDNNSGTFPIQSERLYHAVKGHGGTARLVMLPHESHGYRARESILHVLAEMIEWFDTHVKYATVRESAGTSGSATQR